MVRADPPTPNLTCCTHIIDVDVLVHVYDKLALGMHLQKHRLVCFPDSHEPHPETPESHKSTTGEPSRHTKVWECHDHFTTHQGMGMP